MSETKPDLVKRFNEYLDRCRDNGTPLGTVVYEMAAEIERLRAALAAETERCARLAENGQSWRSADVHPGHGVFWPHVGFRIAACIRTPAPEPPAAKDGAAAN